MQWGEMVLDLDHIVSSAVDGGHLGHPTPICSGSTNVGEDLNFTSQFEDVSYCVDRKALSSITFDTDQILKSFLIETLKY